ncbi:hypothetical protein L3Z90_003126 [Escherichia coli]|nr:hypothetical protein [Escherichia coli]
MGKGSSKGHTPREAKDNLKSTQLLSVIDAISEGPVEGPVDGLKSVLLNSTPVLDSEGNTNISGVTVVFRAGEQEQTPPEGFESSGSETVLGTEVKYDTPITRTITSANIDRLRFTFGVQALVETTSKGDRNPSEVRLLVQIQRNGGWVTEKDITIKGKTTSQYLASVVVDNLPPRPFNIRMRRMTPDSTTDQLQNKTLWSSYTEIIDVKQCYPNTALVGVQVDSEQFGSQQVSRNYHLRGRILQVPSNYNPQTRQYSGIWDGTFKPAYSNNMAWCLWDMLTHPRYGMGKRLGAADVDKWALYVIGQNCDQSVPDGFGGTEPRITCNAWLTTQRKAWDVLSDFCSAMRCMPVWNGQTLTFVQDRPSDKVWTYNRSNVVMPDDGAPFRYSFSALKDRHNAVEVNWIDPANGNETPMFVAQGNQIFMNEVFLKYLTAPTITSGGNPPAFSLTPDGRLTAKNADISGNVNANSGTLNNVTINENCRVLGKLSANQIEGDLVKTVGKAFPRDSRAPERWPSGTITVRVYDDQPFDRQIVIPAVAFSGAKHEREHTDIYSSCRLIVRKNGAEIYNRTALDNTLIYSGVIDMPAGHGHMTLEFSVSAWLVNGWYPTASISDLLVVVMKKATAGITIS